MPTNQPVDPPGVFDSFADLGNAILDTASSAVDSVVDFVNIPNQQPVDPNFTGPVVPTNTIVEDTTGLLTANDYNNASNVASSASTTLTNDAIANLGIVDTSGIPNSTLVGVTPEQVTQTSPTATPTFATIKPVDDWRLRLHLGENATCLYKATDAGILEPLRKTNGIIFPYTPSVSVQHNAMYEPYDLVHSNYRGYFYKGSNVQNLVITATFTAQDTAEANYMLAALHFLKSATKMFYGQDTNRGMPPPVLFLTGLGEYNFKNHPVVVTTMNYNLPPGADFIAAGVPDNVDPTEKFQYNTGANSGYNSPESRLAGSGLSYGAEPKPSTSSTTTASVADTDGIKIYEGKTYVPTKIDFNFMLLPIQTRTQVSSGFSAKEYATGSLNKKGFW